MHIGSSKLTKPIGESVRAIKAKPRMKKRKKRIGEIKVEAGEVPLIGYNMVLWSPDSDRAATRDHLCDDRSFY